MKHKVLIPFLFLCYLFLTVLGILDAAASEFSVNAQRLVVEALCNESDTATYGRWQWESIPDDREGMLTVYSKRKGISSTSLKSVFEKTDYLIAQDGDGTEKRASYIYELMRLLESNVPERGTNGFSKGLNTQLLEILAMYSDNQEKSSKLFNGNGLDESELGNGNQNSNIGEKRNSSRWLMWIIVFFSLAISTVAIVLFFSNRKTLNDEIEKRRIRNSDTADSISNLRKELERLSSELSDLVNSQNSMKLELENQSKIKPSIISTSVSESTSSRESDNHVKREVVKPSEFYVSYPDLTNGFTVGTLQIEPENEALFRVVVDGDTASFSLHETDVAQRAVAENYLHNLSGVCHVENPSASSGHILKTEEHGKLRLVDGKWNVTDKLSLRYV